MSQEQKKNAAEGEVTRRDFLYITTAAMGGVGAAAAIWPLIDTMNPAQDVLAVSTTEVDLSPIPEGSAITVMWQGKPVFVRHRTADEIQKVNATPLKDLVDPQNDADRIQKDHEKWLVVVGLCTHLGCVPIGQKPTENRGDFGGWFCPCHGSHYDASGRIRKGPAPKNLLVPPYAFVSDKLIRIG